MNVFPQRTVLLLFFSPSCAACQWDDKLGFCDIRMAGAYLLMLYLTKLLKENDGSMLLDSISLKLTHVTGCTQIVML